LKKDMTVGKEGKLIFYFALPLMIGNLIQHLYTTVDGIIIGNFIGELALSALGTTMPLMILFLALAIGLSIGCGVIIAQNFGAKNFAHMPTVVSTILILATGIGLVISALAFLLSPLLLRYVLSVPDDVFELAITYFQIFSLGIVFQFIYNAVAAILRSVGDVKVTLYLLIISSVLNIILSLLVVLVFGWGVGGVAWTTVISKIVAAVIAYLYMARRHPYLKPHWVFDRPTCKQALKLSLPNALQFSILSIAHMAMGRLVNTFGVTSIAAYAVAIRIEGFAFIPIMAFNSSIMTFTGQNVGAGRFDRVKTGLLKTEGMATLSCAGLIVILLIFAAPLVRLFGLEGETLARSVEQIRFLTPFFLILSVHLMVSGTLKGAGDVIFPSIATTLDLAVRVGLAYSLVHAGILGYNGAWATVPIGWVLLLILGLLRLRSGKWKTKSVVGTERSV